MVSKGNLYYDLSSNMQIVWNMKVQRFLISWVKSRETSITLHFYDQLYENIGLGVSPMIK